MRGTQITAKSQFKGKLVDRENIDTSSVNKVR